MYQNYLLVEINKQNVETSTVLIDIKMDPYLGEQERYILDL